MVLWDYLVLGIASGRDGTSDATEKKAGDYGYK